MDTLSSNIASVCPLGFSGTGGEMFLRAVTTMIAAHCTIITNREWPDDKSEEVIEKIKGKTPIKTRNTIKTKLRLVQELERRHSNHF